MAKLRAKAQPMDERSTRHPVLPVGFPLGTSHPIGHSEREEYDKEIRKGDDFYGVTDAQYLFWSLTFQAVDRETLLREYAGGEIEQSAVILDGLLEAGLLVEMRDIPLENTSLLETHRLYPTGLGIGNSRENPSSFVIAHLGGQSRLKVDVRVYTVWSLLTLNTSIADACRRLADEFDADVNRIFAQLAVNLPVLIKSGLAFLDEI